MNPPRWKICARLMVLLALSGCHSFDVLPSAAQSSAPQSMGLQRLVLPGRAPVALDGQLSASDATLASGASVETVGLTVGTGAFEVVLISRDFDTFLIVTAPDGRVWENDDDEGSIRRSSVLVPYADATPGEWRIHVTSYAPGEAGAYRLVVRRPFHGRYPPMTRSGSMPQTCGRQRCTP